MVTTLSAEIVKQKRLIRTRKKVFSRKSIKVSFYHEKTGLYH